MFSAPLYTTLEHTSFLYSFVPPYMVLISQALPLRKLFMLSYRFAIYPISIYPSICMPILGETKDLCSLLHLSPALVNRRFLQYNIKPGQSSGVSCGFLLASNNLQLKNFINQVHLYLMPSTDFPLCFPTSCKFKFTRSCSKEFFRATHSGCLNLPSTTSCNLDY